MTIWWDSCRIPPPSPHTGSPPPPPPPPPPPSTPPRRLLPSPPAPGGDLAPCAPSALCRRGRSRRRGLGVGRGLPPLLVPWGGPGVVWSLLPPPPRLVAVSGFRPPPGLPPFFPLRVQLRHRGAARRRGRPAVRAHPRRQGAPDVAGLHLREGAAARPLPERRRPPVLTAHPPLRRATTARSRRSTGTRRSARSPPGSRRARRPRRRLDLLLRRRRPGEPPAAAPTRPRRGASARALPLERAGPGEDRRVLGQRQDARRQRRGDFEHCEVAVFIGKNPWHSHSFPRARTTLKEIARDPDRSLIVVDPRRTETADLADIHLQVRPGTDAWLMAALAARDRRGGPGRRRLVGRARHGADEMVAALRGRSTSPSAPPSPASTRTWCGRRPAHRPGRERGRVRGPRRADEPALDAGQLPGEADLAAHRQLRAGRAVRAFGAGAARRQGRGPSGSGDDGPAARWPAPASSVRPGAVQRDRRRDPDRPPRPLPGDAGRERQPGPLAGRQPAHARGAAALERSS